MDFCPDYVTKWYENATQDQKVKALIIGHYIVVNSLYELQGEDYRKHSETIKKQYDIQLESIKQKLMSEYNDQMQRVKNQHYDDIEMYREKIMSVSDVYMEKYEKFLKEQLNNAKDLEINTLKEQLVSFKSSNMYKGEVGELELKEIIVNKFIGYEIKDASSGTKTADIHVYSPENKFIAIECKNKAVIATTDVNKSIQDIKNLKTDSNFIGYLFVSIRSNNIPKKGNLLYEIIDEIPVIWYGTKDKYMLDHDIEKLVKILFMYKSSKSSSELEEALNDYFSRIGTIKKTVEQSVKSIKDLNNSILSIKSSIDGLYDDIVKLLGNKEPEKNIKQRKIVRKTVSMDDI